MPPRAEIDSEIARLQAERDRVKRESRLAWTQVQQSSEAARGLIGGARGISWLSEVLAVLPCESRRTSQAQW